MANTTTPYNEIFYVQNALFYFKKALGMASRINRTLDPTPRAQGDTIRVRRPGTFTAQNAPSSAQDLKPISMDLKLDDWKEVKARVPDNERALSANQLIGDHIAPMAYALADYVDAQLCAQYVYVPWWKQLNGTFDLGDFTQPRQQLFDNQAPMNDGQLYVQLNGSTEAKVLKSLGVSTLWGAGVDGARIQGAVPPIFGFQPFVNQNAPTHTTTVAADATGALTVATAVGDLAITFNGVTISGAFKKGDTFTITGDAQKYCFTADFSADGAGLVTAAPIWPAIKQVNAISAVVTIDKQGAAKGVNMCFHRNAFYMAMAPLPMDENGNGVVMATASDPVSGLSLRYRRFYDGNNSATFYAFDILFGLKTFDPNLAVRLYDA